MRESFQFVWRGLLAFLLIFTLLAATEHWFAAGPLQQEQAPEKARTKLLDLLKEHPGHEQAQKMLDELPR